MTAPINTMDVVPDEGVSARTEVGDPLVDALRAVLSANLRFALADAWAKHMHVSEGGTPDEVVARTYGFPVSLAIMPGTQRPCLAVWRQTSKFKQAGKKHHRRVTMGVRYWMDQVPFDHLDRRWPMLNEVFEVIADTLAGNSRLDIETSADGFERFPSTDILHLAGMVSLFPDTITSRVDFATDASGDAGFVYPMLDIAFDLETQALSGAFSQDAEGLPDLVALCAAITDARPPRVLGTGGGGLGDSNRSFVRMKSTIILEASDEESGDHA